MAENAGSPSGLTVGEGISLQDKTQYFPWVNQLIRYDAVRGQREAARHAAKSKDDQDLQDLYKDIHIDPSKFHRILVPEIQKDAAQTWAKIVAAHDEDPSNYRFKAINEIQGLQNRLMQQQALSQNYGQLKSIPRNQLTAPQQEAMNILDSGTIEDLKKFRGDELGSVQKGDDNSLRFGWNVDRSKNHTGEFQNVLKSIDVPPMDAAGNPTSKIIKGKPMFVGNKQVVPLYETNTVPIEQAIAKGEEYWTSNPTLFYKQAEDSRSEILKGEIKIDHPDGTTEKIVVKNPDGSVNDQVLHDALFKKWFNESSAGNLTRSRPVSYQEYTPPQPPQPTQADKNKTWQREGNTLSNDKNVWHYDKKDDGTEIYTFSKTNPSENLPLDFKQTDGEIVKGVPVRMEIKKGDKAPTIFVVQTTNSADEGQVITEVPVKYSPYNASKIENEYGKNVFQVRQAITGTLGESNVGTGATKTQSVKSTSKSSGSTSSDTETFVVEGVTYNIPKEKVSAFKKAKGL